MKPPKRAPSLYQIPKFSSVLVAFRYNFGPIGFVEASDLIVAYRDLLWIEEKLEHERLSRTPQFLDHVVCSTYRGTEVSEGPIHRGVHDFNQ